MVNTRNNPCNGQASNSQPNNTNNNPQIEQLIATQNQLMLAVLQTLNHLQPNLQDHQQQPPPPPQSRLGEFFITRPTTFSQAKDPMDAEDWLRSIEKKLEIAQCTDQEKVLFAAHQIFGTAANGGKRTATPARMSALSPGMSLKLDSELSTYLVVCSN
jgi:hypothetical protein